jgi:hypothetical protein
LLDFFWPIGELGLAAVAVNVLAGTLTTEAVIPEIYKRNL